MVKDRHCGNGLALWLAGGDGSLGTESLYSNTENRLEPVSKMREKTQLAKLKASQGLKPSIFGAFDGTAKPCPDDCHKTSNFETGSSNGARTSSSRMVN